MKLVKGIGLFFVYPLTFLVIGFVAGVQCTHFFYPGEQAGQTEFTDQDYYAVRGELDADNDDVWGETDADNDGVWGETDADGDMTSQETGQDAEFRETSQGSETLSVETEYVLWETDVTTHTVVETTWRIPDKYIGMNREQFLLAMENYAAFPPLKELEKGFVSLEVLSFSRERVIVQMNYCYVQPSTCFYLGVYDNMVRAYLEDGQIVYIETDIRLDTLPEDVQDEIIGMMWVEDEETLYNFLESYSS